jgi:acyl-homoserine-lactone acylase
MRVYLFIAVVLLVLVGAVSVVALVKNDRLNQVAADKYRAEIRRTSYGIPHIKADNYGSLGFGAGYAFAEDNLCVLADTFVTVNGQRSRFFGPDELEPVASGLGDPVKNLDSDFFYAKINQSGVIEALLDSKNPRAPSQQTRETVRGYAAGWNAYLRDIKWIEKIPDKQCRGEPGKEHWVRPITEMDVYRRVYQLSLLMGSVQLLPEIVAAGPPAPSAPPPEPIPPDFRPPPESFPSADTVEMGSNAYGLGRQTTTSGRGMVLANPHFPWFGPLRLSQLHLTIPGVVDVTGAALFGFPFVQIGHNQRLAWSHTVSPVYRFSVYELKLVPGDPTAYLYNGQVRRMKATTVTVDAKTPAGMEQRSHTFYDTHYGPMLDKPNLRLSWAPGVGYAMRDVNADNLRIFDHYLAVNRAKDVRELETVSSRLQGAPWVHTIAADDTGKAFYADMSVAPHITNRQIDTCITSPIGAALKRAARLPVLDGSRSACEWGSDRDAVVPGIYGPAALPKLHRDDYVANSNDSHWLTNPAKRLEGYPYVMGAERDLRRLRTRLGIRMIQQRLDGTDGRPGKQFTLEQLQETVFNNRDYAGELVGDDLVAECKEGPTVTLDGGTTVDIRNACDVLEHWDRHANLDSTGVPLFREFMTSAFPSPLGFFADQFNPDDPVNTPRTLNRLNPDIRRAIGIAVKKLEDAKIPLNAKLGEVQFARRNNERIPIHGGTDGDADSIFNLIRAPFVPEAGGYPDTLYGSSFVMAVEFTNQGPRGRSILTYSQSTNPDSPHFADQTRLHSDKQWVDMLFTENAIINDPKYRTYTATG